MSTAIRCLAVLFLTLLQADPGKAEGKAECLSKEGKKCIEFLKQRYGHGKQSMHYAYRNICEKKVYLVGTVRTSDGREELRKVAVGAGLEYEIGCTKPGGIASCTVEGAHGECIEDEGIKHEASPPRKKLPPPPEKADSDESRRVDKICNTSATGCQHWCRTTFASKEKKLDECLNSDGCMGQIPSCMASGGTWTNPKILLDEIASRIGAPDGGSDNGPRGDQEKPKTTSFEVVCKPCQSGNTRCMQKGIKFCQFHSINGKSYEFCPPSNYKETVSCDSRREFVLKW